MVESSHIDKAIVGLNLLLDPDNADIRDYDFTSLIVVVVGAPVEKEKMIGTLVQILEQWPIGTTKINEVTYEFLAAVVKMKFPEKGDMKEIGDELIKALGCYYGVT